MPYFGTVYGFITCFPLCEVCGTAQVNFLLTDARYIRKIRWRGALHSW